MTVLKALIARAQGPQPLRTIATVDWSAKKSGVSFRSYDVSLPYHGVGMPESRANIEPL